MPSRKTTPGNDRQALEEALHSSAAALEAAVEGVSDFDARIQPSSGRWSILENIEHVAIVDKLFSARIASTQAGLELILNPEREADITTKVPLRQSALSAPEMALPRGEFLSVPAALTEFHRVRQLVASILTEREHELRFLPVRHPVFGNVSGFEAFLLLAAHARRHINHIEEVKSSLQNRSYLHNPC